MKGGCCALAISLDRITHSLPSYSRTLSPAPAPNYTSKVKQKAEAPYH